MNTTIPERISEMNREIGHLRKRVATQQIILLGLISIIGVTFCLGVSSPQPTDGHFDRVFAKSVIIRSTNNAPTIQLYALEDTASLLIRDSSGHEAIQLISGPERNDLFINNRNDGRIAVAVQGTNDRGRLSLHRTFSSMSTAEQVLEQKPREYLTDENEKEITVPILRLPEHIQ